MADGGDEGTVYGLLTTVANLGGPVASALSNQIFGLFKPSLSNSSNYLDSSPAFQRAVAWSYGLFLPHRLSLPRHSPPPPQSER